MNIKEVGVLSWVLYDFYGRATYLNIPTSKLHFYLHNNQIIDMGSSYTVQTYADWVFQWVKE